MNRDDREAFDTAVDALRALGSEVCESASTLLTQFATHVAHQANPETAKAVLQASRLVYVIAHETIEESIG